MSLYDVNGNILVDTQKKTDIISLNPDVPFRLTQAKRPNRSTDPDGYTKVTQPAAFLWFTDIHQDETALERLVEFRDHYVSDIEDTICTGDMVRARYVDGMGFWHNVDGAESILLCIGNHDAYKPDNNTRATQQEQFNQYFSPYIANWGNVQIETGKTYYYKDYTEKNVRLVMINCMLQGSDETEQETWFASTLASAKTAGLSVVVGSHYSILGTKIESNFSNHDVGQNINTYLPDFYASAVQSFIDDGGEFICYLVGHWHCDVFCKGRTYENQYTIIMDAATPTYANKWGNDNVRVIGTKSEDLANLIVFDTASKIVKIIRVGADLDRCLRTRNCFSFNYLTGEIISDW